MSNYRTLGDEYLNNETEVDANNEINEEEDLEIEQGLFFCLLYYNKSVCHSFILLLSSFFFFSYRHKQLGNSVSNDKRYLGCWTVEFPAGL